MASSTPPTLGTRPWLPLYASPPTADDESNWAELLPDILCLIARRLSIPDFVRLHAVCTSWASALNYFLPLAPHFRWLMLMRFDGELSFLIPPENRYLDGVRCVASQDGWLVIIDDPLEARILKSLTGAQIRLPSFSTLPGLFDSIQKIVLLANRFDGGVFIAMAIYTFWPFLAFARTGDKAWTHLYAYSILHDSDKIEDIVCHDEHFFAISARGQLEDFGLNGSLFEPIMILECSDRYINNGHDRIYLVPSSFGDLLQVRSKRCSDTGLTLNFIIMKFNPAVDSDWSEIKDLGDRSLFLDGKHSISLSTGDVPGLKGNCIYFVERSDYEKVIINDLRVFDIEKGIIGLPILCSAA